MGASPGKFFTLPPAGYTAKTLFEIDDRVCTARKAYLDYYPVVPKAVLNAPEIADDGGEQSTKIPAPRKRQPGRPKKKKTTLKANQPSILQFFFSKPKPTST
ncbi:hypothetical protein PHMEG_0009623 [Phytophthora megakarya]|uniref:Uncharacterized protein n=1 Tax=Phytophthora megakarya TaxID=4795 RepID=A0A225WH53_9STRA|nr:hypothetical protein PHMEG_0009623 [Phytophthora megakarya]